MFYEVEDRKESKKRDLNRRTARRNKREFE